MLAVFLDTFRGREVWTVQFFIIFAGSQNSTHGKSTEKRECVHYPFSFILRKFFYTGLKFSTHSKQAYFIIGPQYRLDEI